MIRVKDKNGTEALVTEAAFEKVWKDKGFTLIEDEPAVPTTQPPKGKVFTESSTVKTKRKDSTK